MTIVKSYIVNEEGKPEAVVVDYATFKKLEELLLDSALGKAMEEASDDEEFNIEETKKIADFSSPAS